MDFNPSIVILCQEVREWDTLYVYTYIFAVNSLENLLALSESWCRVSLCDIDQVFVKIF